MEFEYIFLFGAGASKGATHIQPYAPPLGNEVYDELAKHFPKEWGPATRIGKNYGNLLKKDFEKTMFNEVCRWNPSICILEWQRSMALYFSKFIIDSTKNNLYSKLISSLCKSESLSKTIFASLNYDCLFEQAAAETGLQVDYTGNQTGDNFINVLKLHGSCTFITPDIQTRRRFLTNPNSCTDCMIDFLPPENVKEFLESIFSDSQRCYYPVMSLYSFGKNSLVAGSRVQKLRNTWREKVIASSDIVIIGVRPNPEDMHVWKPLMETSANVHYVGSESDFNIWASENSNFRFIAERFEDGFGNVLELLNI